MTLVPHGMYQADGAYAAARHCETYEVRAVAVLRVGPTELIRRILVASTKPLLMREIRERLGGQYANETIGATLGDLKRRGRIKVGQTRCDGRLFNTYAWVRHD